MLEKVLTLTFGVICAAMLGTGAATGWTERLVGSAGICAGLVLLCGRYWQLAVRDAKEQDLRREWSGRR